jgi:hypothetical protein
MCRTFEFRGRDDAVGGVQKVQEVGRVAGQHQREESRSSESHLRRIHCVIELVFHSKKTKIHDKNPNLNLQIKL